MNYEKMKGLVDGRIPDETLIRLLRIDRASHIYPTVQGTDALLRAYDKALAELAAVAAALKVAQ
jgi:hypothetical protein